MDNVCHTLVGAALGRAGLAHRTKWGSAALMVAANLPDIDVAVFATGTPSVAFRRGWTHGVLAQALLPVALVLVMLALERRRGVEGDGTRCRPGWLLALAYVGVYSHVFLDYLNNYGVRLLTPVDWRWFYGDAVFIVDPWLWLSLGLGVWLARRTGRPRPARVAVAVAAGYVVAMLALAQQARTYVYSAWQAQSGRAPHALMVGPVPIIPWRREVIIDTGDAYRTGLYSVWPPRLDLSEEVVPKNDQGAGVADARRDPDVAAFLVWSRFPFWHIDGVGDERVPVVRDMRFRGRTGGGFVARPRVSRASPPAALGAGPRGAS